MQEWIIAMLVISVLLILRDMAKTILTGRMSKKEEAFSLCEEHPQKEKVERYAASFQKLADTFYGMPYKKEFLSSGQIDNILVETNAQVCANCYHRELCWGNRSTELCKGVESIVRAMEAGNEEKLDELRTQWSELCGKTYQYLDVIRRNFRNEKQNLVWTNRMIESRLAVAQQLTEIAGIMEMVASDLYDISPAEPEFQEELRRMLRRRHVILKQAWVMDKAEGRRQFVMCLSDGMGSGMDACRESEIVVELLEQFLESGFTQEAAARMVNSALVLKGQEGMFSTVDICAVDLYTGICEFLKAGAASTFIKRDHWVEAISSESLAAGLVQRMDFDMASRKLYHGDYLIMMTDGVLDALPTEREEETMKEIIMDIQDETPREVSRGILERVLGYSDYRARDDMTVLVASVVRK